MGTKDWRGTRRAAQISVGVVAWLFGLPSLVLAHGGGMTGQELRPMAISGAVALVGYWTVVLWPKRREAAHDYRAPLREMRSGHGRLSLKSMFGRGRDRAI